MSRFDSMFLKMIRLGKPIACISVSLLAHIVALYASGIFGSLDFAVPVILPSVISVDLQDLPRQQEPLYSNEDEAELHAKQFGELTAKQQSVPATEATPKPLPDTVSIQAVKLPELPLAISASDETEPPSHSPTLELLQPLRHADEFMITESETLNYRIYLLGIPVGTARLEARRDKGEVRITLKVTSDPILSSIYPVDDLIETRHINGNFITSRIRQKEGSFTSDRGFTIFLRDKSVFWIDRLARKSVREAIPTSEVVDLLSGFYYLRNRQLAVGRAETVHIYDSDSYAAVPVDVLQRETIRLANFREINSLLVQPRLKTGGIFKRTGDILIWLSDDDLRVPVKVVTSIALGRVTAELVSAEAKYPDRHETQK